MLAMSFRIGFLSSVLSLAIFAESDPRFEGGAALVSQSDSELVVAVPHFKLQLISLEAAEFDKETTLKVSLLHNDLFSFEFPSGADREAFHAERTLSLGEGRHGELSDPGNLTGGGPAIELPLWWAHRSALKCRLGLQTPDGKQAYYPLELDLSSSEFGPRLHAQEERAVLGKTTTTDGSEFQFLVKRTLEHVRVALVPENSVLTRDELYHVRLLGKNIPAEMVPRLVATMERGPKESWGSVILALEAMGPHAESALPSLMKNLREEAHPNVYRVLGAIGPKAVPAAPLAIESLLKATRAEKGFALNNYTAVHSAAEGLGALGVSVIPSLLTVPVGVSTKIDFFLAATVNQLGKNSAYDRSVFDPLVKPLLAIAAKGENRTRGEAMQALAKISSHRTSPDVFRLLTNAASSSDWYLRTTAKEALKNPVFQAVRK